MGTREGCGENCGQRWPFSLRIPEGALTSVTRSDQVWPKSLELKCVIGGGTPVAPPETAAVVQVGDDGGWVGSSTSCHAAATTLS